MLKKLVVILGLLVVGVPLYLYYTNPLIQKRVNEDIKKLAGPKADIVLESLAPKPKAVKKDSKEKHSIEGVELSSRSLGLKIRPGKFCSFEDGGMRDWVLFASDGPRFEYYENIPLDASLDSTNPVSEGSYRIDGYFFVANYKTIEGEERNFIGRILEFSEKGAIHAISINNKKFSFDECSDEQLMAEE